MNNNSSTGGSCLAMIVLGILFILWPIIITLYSLSSGYLPVIITYSCAIISMVACFTFVRDLTAKFGISGSIAFFFAVIYCSWYSTYELRGNYDDGGLGDLIGMFFGCLTLIVPCFFIGGFFEKKLIEYKRNKNEMKKAKISKEIERLKLDNDSLNIRMSTHRRELKLLDLLEKCGGDITTLENDAKFEVFISIEEKINNNDKGIKELRKQLEKL